MYNLPMTSFRFYYPISVRYGDLDPQGHVNNAKYLTYMEQARIAYLQHLGLWDGHSFLDVGIILADARVSFRAAILLGEPIRAGVRISRIGTKSLDMEYILENSESFQVKADGSSVLVAYSYLNKSTVAVSGAWRRVITEFEKLQDP